MQAAWLRPTGAGNRLRRAAFDGARTGRVHLGWAVMVAATLALTLVAAGDGILPGDVAVTRTIQTMSLPGLDQVVAAVNAIGGTLGSCLVATTLVWWCLRRGHGAAALVVLGALALRFGNALIKLPVGSPRPGDEVVRVVEDANGYGFPSAHVMGVVVLYGAVLVLAPELIRCRARRCIVQVAALLMLLTIGLGRIHVGAHWPSDVVGAYLYGILGLAGLLALYRAVRRGQPAGPNTIVHWMKSRTGGLTPPISQARRTAAQTVPVRITGGRE